MEDKTQLDSQLDAIADSVMGITPTIIEKPVKEQEENKELIIEELVKEEEEKEEELEINIREDEDKQKEEIETSEAKSEDVLNSEIEKSYKDYGIKNKEDLDNLFVDYAGLIKDLEVKSKQLEELKTKQLPEGRQNLVDFINQYDPENPRAIEDYIRLQTMNTKELSDFEALKELFLIENKDQPKSLAERVFNKKYEKTYGEDEDDDAQLEFDAQNARKKLEKLKIETKIDATKTEEKTEKGVDVLAIEIDKSKKQYLSQVDKAMVGFKQVTLEANGIPNKFNYVFKSDEIDAIQATVKSFIQSKGSYSDKGEIPNFSLDNVMNQAIYMLYGKQIAQASVKYGMKLQESKMVEERSKVKPTISKKGEQGSSGSTGRDIFDMIGEAAMKK